MFNNMDTDGSGTITYEELKTGLSRLGSKLTESEIKQLMDAVRMFRFICVNFIINVYTFLHYIFVDCRRMLITVGR